MIYTIDQIKAELKELGVNDATFTNLVNILTGERGMMRIESSKKGYYWIIKEQENGLWKLIDQGGSF